MNDFKVYRCRWCGRKVSGLWRLFHNPATCKRNPANSIHRTMLIVNQGVWGWNCICGASAYLSSFNNSDLGFRWAHEQATNHEVEGLEHGAYQGTR